MNTSAIFSKTGKGVQEAGGKTSHLSRGDRAVLSAIDGKTSLGEVQKKFDKLAGPKFEALIQQLDKDGFIREVSSGAAPEPITPLRKAATPPPAAKAPPKAAAGSDDLSDGLDFTQAVKMPSKGPAAPAPSKPPVDFAAAARAEAERKAKEQAAVDFRGRQEAEAKAAAEAKARAEAEAKSRAAAEAKAREEAEAKARAEATAKADAEAKARVDSESKAKAARDMALRMAAEAKAKAEAEAKDKARLEAELKAKLDEERKAREEAEKRAAAAAEKARLELEEKAKRDAEELRQKLEAEMKAKLEEERRLREKEDRKRREEEDRRRKEEDERRAKEEAERRAKEEAERRAREEEDRKRREAEDRRRKEEEERRAKEEAERRAREEADRKRREEEDRRRKEEDERRAKEDAERRAKEEAERKAKEEAERKRRDEEDRRRKEEDERRAKEEGERKAKEESERKRREQDDRRRREEDERRAKEDAERKSKAEAERKAKEEAAAAAPAAPAAAPAAGAGDFGSLLSDLDSFGQKEEEERKAKEEAEKKAKEEAARRAAEEAERKAKEEAEKQAREEAARREKEEAERKAKEEAERREREEEERRKAEEEERKRKAKEAAAAKEAEKKADEEKARAKADKAAAKAKGGDAIGVSDEDLDMDDVKRDEKAISREARLAAKDREQVAAVKAKRPVKWGRPAAIALFVILIGGVGALHVMPLSTAEYEKAASEALGAPVKVSSARLSMFTGVQVNLEGVTVGDAKFRLVRGYPEIGSVFGPKKVFSRLEIEGATLTQEQAGRMLLAGKAGSDSFRASRIVFKQVKLEGPLTLPALDLDATIGGDGNVQIINIAGPITGKVTPSGSNAAFEIQAANIAVPFVPALTLSDFGWKGTATPQGITSSEWDGRAFDGLFSGNARVRWGSTWTVEGEVRARGAKVAVFAPTLVSDGKVEGRGNYTMSGSNPAKLGESARLEGSFKIESGVIGNFALRRALETGGAQTTGRTEFAELTGQGVYDKGAVQLRNLNIAAGAMAAGASLDIDAGGALAGRIAAEVKTPNQTLRAVLNISGSLQNPVIRK